MKYLPWIAGGAALGLAARRGRRVESLALSRIAALHDQYRAEDYDGLMAQADDPAVVRRFAAELRSLDEYLTDRVYTHAGAYEGPARRILEGRTVVLHLADGGYSRLSIGITESPLPWMDEGLSLPKALSRWRDLRSRT